MQRDMLAIPEVLLRSRAARAEHAAAPPLEPIPDGTSPDELVRPAAPIPSTPPRSPEPTTDMSTTIPDDQLGLF
jgi:hypothetical protein